MSDSPKHIVVTGANGFIGKNLVTRLMEYKYCVIPITRETTVSALTAAIEKADFIFHLAGINRPKHEAEFVEGNVDYTQLLCDTIAKVGRRIPIVYTSSTQVDQPNEYGRSKLKSEQILIAHNQTNQSPVAIFRLTNVFGKWCRPNYNSVVATFCYNTANNLPFTINDPDKPLALVHIDDVVSNFIATLTQWPTSLFCPVSPTYNITVGELANLITKFKQSRQTLITEKVGAGLARLLYSTYVSYYSSNQFNYSVPVYSDERGTFVEMLKTADSGQVSFFTAHPGVTRGGHYHHTKTEKFLVVRGKALFSFRNIITNEIFSYQVSGNLPEVVETIPGWAHNITNIGDDELIAMIWANENFNPQQPDTISSEVLQ